MTLFFALSIIAGIVLLLLSYMQRNAPADAWPPGLDNPGVGIVLVAVGLAGELCLWIT
jgi:hypothetical protein